MLESVINYKFKDDKLLLTALVHKSYANEEKAFLGINNEKLELLGDAVLGLTAIEYIYGRFPTLFEGELVKLKSMLVSEAALVSFANKISLSHYLYLSKGEVLQNGSHRPSILADAFEALLGAIYLDGGIEEVKNFFIPLLSDKINAIYDDEDCMDYKTCLQEFVQDKFKALPYYKTLSMAGPDHDKVFTVAVNVLDKLISKGQGKSKKEAEQKAAQAACRHFSVRPVRFL